MERDAQGKVWRDVVMVFLAVLSILLIFLPGYYEPARARETELLYLDLAFIAVFWLEYLARLRRADDKRRFIRVNWYEIPGMVPILPGMERFASVRFFRLLRLMRILRLVGALRRIEGFERFVQTYVRRSKLGYVASLAVGLIFGCATLAWYAEPGTFHSYWDAVWWAIVTSTTVGYGDFVPVTGAGRSIGIVLMLLGVVIIGTLAGTLGSYLTERRVEEERTASRAFAQPQLPIPGMGTAAELERLAQLHRRGDITDGEYAAAKRRILGPATRPFRRS